MFIGPHTIHTSSSVDLFVAGKGVIMFVLTTVRFSTYHLRASSCSYTFFFLDDIRPLGEAPAYITQAASAFMFEDLEDCCVKYYW